jgi:cell division septal protein FtsQ
MNRNRHPQQTEPVTRRPVRRFKRKGMLVGAGKPMIEAKTLSPRWHKREASVRQAPFVLRIPRITFAWDKIVALLLFAAGATGMVQIGNHDSFYVYSMDVQGNAILPQKEVEKATGIMNWNVYYIDPHLVESTLEKLPEVKTAHVELGLPNSVWVDLQERRPIFIWQGRSQRYWVDREGIVMKERRPINLPVVVDTDQRELQAGARINSDAVEAVAAWLQVVPVAVRQFAWSSARGLSFVDEHGWKIYLGNANQMPEKSLALRTVTNLITQSNKKVNFIDVGEGLPYFQEAALPKSQ